MKKRYALLATATILLASSCDREPELTPNLGDSFVLSATLEQPMTTRTIVQLDGSVVWDAAEKIKVFWGDKSAEFTSVNESPAASVSFVGAVDGSLKDGDEIWALYPYREDATFSDGGIITRIPEDQVACAGTFARNTNVTVARSTTSTLRFYNLCGGVRFSLSEEGIKKVVFEGLGGEAIAGKVKIAFDDNDRPFVTEVIEGRLFITLTPPTGESFKTGQWYYISALPGTLEKGFKLRFYKDETYARQLSEKSVTIKRSVFGSLNSPDTGIEFKATSTPFPQTEDDIVKSNSISEGIAPLASSILHAAINDETGEVDIEQVVSEVNKIEYVISAEVNAYNSAVLIKQCDNTFINLILNSKYKEYSTEKTQEDFTTTVAPNGLKLQNDSARDISNNQSDIVIPKKKRALLLAPFLYDFKDYDITIGYLKELLDCIGFDTSDSILIDLDAGIEAFEINNMCQYGIVIISTHGLCAGKTIDGESSSLLVSGTPLGGGSLTNLAIFRNLGKCIIVYQNGDFVCNYCLTVPWMEACANDFTVFEQGLVFTMACQTTRDSDLKDSFFKYQAGAFCGYSDNVFDLISTFRTNRVFNYLAYGSDLSRACSRANYSTETLEFIDYLSFYYKMNPSVNIKPFIDCYINPIHSNKKYYLYSLMPYNLEARQVSNQLLFSWVVDETKIPDTPSATWSIPYPLPHSKLSLQYEVYVDNTLITTTNDKNLLINNLPEGMHTWYVITKVFDNMGECGSFRSETEVFVTNQTDPYIPYAVDLGLSVNWATWNVGATRPEGYGDYYAWGETEPKDANYDMDSYKWYTSSYTLTKYNTDSNNGIVDNKTTLDPEDDVAQVKWGGSWRIPTKDEWIELIENCTWTWTYNYNETGVSGGIATSNITGYTDRHIFIPEAGMSVLYFVYPGTGAEYWSASLSDDSLQAWSVYNPGQSSQPMMALSRFAGLPIRAVCNK